MTPHTRWGFFSSRIARTFFPLFLLCHFPRASPCSTSLRTNLRGPLPVRRPFLIPDDRQIHFSIFGFFFFFFYADNPPPPPTQLCNFNPLPRLFSPLSFCSFVSGGRHSSFTAPRARLAQRPPSHRAPLFFLRALFFYFAPRSFPSTDRGQLSLQLRRAPGIARLNTFVHIDLSVPLFVFQPSSLSSPN